MKKTFWSLAALMMLMSAPVMTSCSNDIDEVAPAVEAEENVVTLTIKMPEQAETRVGIDNDLKLTGWVLGDVVKVYDVQYNEDENKVVVNGDIPFKCTDPAVGTFTGTLPAGKSLNSYNIATYGHDLEALQDPAFAGFSDNKVSENLKDVVFLVGGISDGKCSMHIHNNVLKVTNNGSPVICAWKNGETFCKLYTLVDEQDAETQLYLAAHAEYILKDSDFGDANFTIPSGTSYVFMPPIIAFDDEKIGLSTENGTEVIRQKYLPSNYVTIGKLFKASIGVPGSTGTTNTTINDVHYGIKWVQLWADGPKFAECNVGFAGDCHEEDKGGYYTWGGSVNINDPYATSKNYYNTGDTQLTGADDTATNLWGAAWRMPTKDELDGLLTNCDSEWTTVNGAPGRKYTGKGAYASNSIFLPAAGYYDNYLNAVKLPSSGYYRSSTPSSYIDEYDVIQQAAYRLYFNEERQEVSEDNRKDGYSVRPVYIH